MSVDRRAVHQRAHQRRRIERVADANLTVGRDERIRHPLRDPLLQKQPPDGGAALPRGAHRAEQHRPQREVEVGVVHHDHAVVAAQVRVGCDRAAAHRFRYAVAHAARTRRAHQRHPPVRKQPLAHFRAAPDHEVEHALPAVAGKHAVADLLHRDRGQRRFRRRLPEHAIPAHRRDHRVPRPYGDREVERRDHAHHAERMPLLIHAVRRALALHRQAVELAREARPRNPRCRSSPAPRPAPRPGPCPFRG